MQIIVSDVEKNPSWFDRLDNQKVWMKFYTKNVPHFLFTFLHCLFGLQKSCEVIVK